MMSNRRQSSRSLSASRNSRVLSATLWGVGLLLLMLQPACSHLVNPYQDTLPAASTITTYSAERVHAAGTPTLAVQQRGWEARVVWRRSPCADHWPVWFLDSFEDKGSDDGTFAWTWEDYLAVLYCPARATVNAAALPASAVVDPVWSIRCSDGRISPQTFGFSNHDPSKM